MMSSYTRVREPVSWDAWGVNPLKDPSVPGHSGTRVVPAAGSWCTLVGGAGVFVNEAKI